MYYAFAVFLAVGIAITGWGAWLIVRGDTDSKRMTTFARLQSIEVKKVDFDDSEQYWVDVCYAYSVNDKQYKAHQIAIGYSASSDVEFHSELKSRIETMNSKKKLAARYHQADPSDAVLTSSTIHFGHFAFLFGTWIVLTMGLFLCLLHLAQVSSRQLLNNLGQ